MLRSWLRRGGTRGIVALSVAMILAVGGGTALAWAATHQSHAPKPSLAQAGTTSPVTPTPARAAATSFPPGANPAQTTGGPVVGPTLSASVPKEIKVPAIDVTSTLLTVGRNLDGTIQVPQPGPDYNRAAWFNGLRSPGELGPAIIEGHIDSAAEGPSVFYRLGALRIGDKIYISRTDGKVVVFAVNAVRSYPKSQFPNNLVYGATYDAALRLITCGGAFDRATGSYLSNTVVFAHLLKAQSDTDATPPR